MGKTSKIFIVLAVVIIVLQGVNLFFNLQNTGVASGDSSSSASGESGYLRENLYSDNIPFDKETFEYNEDSDRVGKTISKQNPLRDMWVIQTISFSRDVGVDEGLVLKDSRSCEYIYLPQTGGITVLPDTCDM